MKKGFIVIFVILFAAGGVLWYGKYQSSKTLPAQGPIVSQMPMKISSSAFESNQNIPVKYTCDGDNVNPPLEFKDVPPQAVSLVLIVDDPDAPAGTWAHWTVWNIDPATTSIAENSVPPKAIAGQTSAGQNTYGGPCPPSGAHRYFFKLYALDTKLSLSSFSLKADLEKAMENHILAQAELVGLYSRGGK